MAGGKGKLTGEDGKQFSTENQPTKRRGKGVASMLKKLLTEIDKKNAGEGDHGKPLAHQLIEFIFKKDDNDKYIHSESTRLKALIDAIDRIDGMAIQRHEIEEGPIKISYFDENEDDNEE